MLTLYRRLADANPNARNVVLTVIEGADFGDKCLLSNGALQWERDAGGFFTRNLDEVRDVSGDGTLEIAGQRVFCELLGHEKQLVICGGGHVSMPLIRLGTMLGMAVTVLEDRPVFAGNARAAGADRVICAPFAEGLEQVPGDGDTFFVIVTRGHSFDTLCLEAISRKPHAYIGMMGSRRKVAMVKETLIRDKGCDPAVIEGVHMPIGMDIGAQTPEEIAVAIMAQIIEVKSRDGRNSAWPRDLLRAIVDSGEKGVPRALATVVARRGSAPRGTGARMLVWPDGRILGTIGGGLLENMAIQSAQRRLAAGETDPCLFEASLSAEAAASEGMVCGGAVTVLIEIIGADEGGGHE